MGVLRSLCCEYLVPITATNGQCGGFLRTDVAPLLHGDLRRVLYIGDLELRGPGEQIEDNTWRVLANEADRDDLYDGAWERVALTQDQVDDDLRLSDLVITKTDGRYKPPKEYEAVECEAIGQAVLVEILRARLDQLVPEPIAKVRKREAAQRKKMRKILSEAAR